MVSAHSADRVRTPPCSHDDQEEGEAGGGMKVSSPGTVEEGGAFGVE